MTTTAKVFASGRSQAIRLPKEFRVSGKVVRLTRVPRSILISEGDPWDAFKEACRELGGEKLTDAARSGMYEITGSATLNMDDFQHLRRGNDPEVQRRAQTPVL